MDGKVALSIRCYDGHYHHFVNLCEKLLNILTYLSGSFCLDIAFVLPLSKNIISWPQNRRSTKGCTFTHGYLFVLS